ncbi:MAG: hypothetical protein M1610_03825 [Nitrospirae bacterium]|nr:hypothetical protein [Nitrospirota bacterium]MDA8337978.1 hypothetical protein [Nitrospiraceae bacterium]
MQHSELLRRSANKRGVLRGCIAALKQYGYLKITRLRDAQGKFDSWEWTVFEGSQTLNKSQSAPKVKKPNFGKTEIRKIGLINNEQPNQTKTTTADVNVVIGKIDGTQFAGAEKSAIAKALKKSGLGPAEADRLIEYLMAKYPGGGDNPPGLLLQALREGWKAPAGFKTAAEKEAERQAAGDNYERRRAAAERENLRRMGLV